MTTTAPYLVLGATGKTGRRVADRLDARGLPVRRAARSSGVRFEWHDRTTWRAALDGARAAWIPYAPDVAVPEARADVVALAEQATAAGVAHLVLLSGRGEPEALAVEEAFAAAAEAGGSTWTVVRSSWFAQNFTEGFFAEPVAAGQLALPVDDVPEPFIDVDDLADVAVAALLDAGAHDGLVHEVTGPRALTWDDAVAEVAAARGHRVELIRIPLDAFVAGLHDAGVTDGEARLMAYLFDEILDGRNAAPTDGVERVLGRPARSFGEAVAFEQRSSCLQV
jgi:uncharacterized protein YbjT (DUF2867 family)